MTPVLTAVLEITGRDGAEQLIIEAAEQRGRHHNQSAPASPNRSASGPALIDGAHASANPRPRA